MRYILTDNTEEKVFYFNYDESPCLTTNFSKALVIEDIQEALDFSMKYESSLGSLKVRPINPDLTKQEVEDYLKNITANKGKLFNWTPDKDYYTFRDQKLQLSSEGKVDYCNPDNIIFALKEAYMACHVGLSTEMLNSLKSEADKRLSLLEHAFESEELLPKEEAYNIYKEMRKLRIDRRKYKKAYALHQLLEKYVDLDAMASMILYLEMYNDYKCAADLKGDVEKVVDSRK